MPFELFLFGVSVLVVAAIFVFVLAIVECVSRVFRDIA